MEVEGYSNYLIYKDGRVWSKKRNKYLKPRINRYGYMDINLCKNGKKKKWSVHRLVALAYIPNPENKPQIDHINRNRKDNRLENLRWATSSENNINKGVSKTNILGVKNISKTKSNTYYIKIIINKNQYCKTCKTLEEAIVQRDLMLSMFNY
jgi:hypothetical protein